MKTTRVLAALVLGAGVLSAGTAGAQTKIDCGTSYTVKRGDTLRDIARRAYGDDDFRLIWTANRNIIGRNVNRIPLGSRLAIPCAPGTAATVRDRTSRTAGAATDRATFEAAPEPAVAVDKATLEAQPKVAIVFNKASAPGFIINTGIIDPILAEIERETGGRVTFVDPPAINRDPKAQLDLVLTGKVDGAYIFNGHLEKTHPLVQITMQPMIGGTARQTATALWRVHRAYFEEAGNFSDVKLLGFFGAPPAQIWRASDAPVDENERLANNNAWAVPYFDGLDTRGASAVRAENAERLQKLDQAPGATPATFALAHGAARMVGVWTNSRAVTEIDGGVYAPTFSVFISREKWDQIGEHDKRTIERLTGEALALRSAAWDAFDNAHKAEMMRQGLKITEAPFDVRAELQDRARVGWEAWMATADEQGIDGYEALEAYFREIRKLKQDYPS